MGVLREGGGGGGLPPMNKIFVITQTNWVMSLFSMQVPWLVDLNMMMMPAQPDNHHQL